MKPSAKQISLCKKALRQRSQKAHDPIERRICQAMEETLRWATEETDWKRPDKDVDSWVKWIKEEQQIQQSPG